MSVTSGFFNSLNGDRKYWAPEFSNLISSIINDGVLMKNGDAFAPSLNNGLSVVIGEGMSWFRNVWIQNDSALPMAVPTPHVLYSRWDAIVLDINSTVSVRRGTITYVQGTPSANPVKPSLVSTADWLQVPLVYVKVDANTTSISSNDLDVRIGQTDCPYVSSIVQTTDISSLYAGWQEDFNNWFEGIENTLEGDVALNLQNQITTLQNGYGELVNRITLLEATIEALEDTLTTDYQRKVLVGLNPPLTSQGQNGDLYVMLED